MADSLYLTSFIILHLPRYHFYLLYTTCFVTLEEIKSCKSLLSYKYYTGGWVQEVGWKKYVEEGIILIVGKVKHSCSANKPPLQPWVLVCCNRTILVAHCMAGLAETCSHVGAILHWVETAVRVCDSTTCTSKDNTWLMPTPTQSIPCLQLSEIDFSAPKCKRVNPLPSSAPVPVHKSIAPSQTEKDTFFHEIATE